MKAPAGHLGQARFWTVSWPNQNARLSDMAGCPHCRRELGPALGQATVAGRLPRTRSAGSLRRCLNLDAWMRIAPSGIAPCPSGSVGLWVPRVAAALLLFMLLRRSGAPRASGSGFRPIHRAFRWAWPDHKPSEILRSERHHLQNRVYDLRFFYDLLNGRVHRVANRMARLLPGSRRAAGHLSDVPGRTRSCLPQTRPASTTASASRFIARATRRSCSGRRATWCAC
jgi:hypothetical protein